MSNLRKLVALLPLLLTAASCSCESGKVSASGDSLPPRIGRSAQPARRAPTATASAAADAVAPQLALKDGATLKLPAGAIARRKPGGLPDMVKGAHNYRLPGGRQRLMVSELDLEGKSCAQRLDAEWARMETARDDKDPERLKLRRTTKIEQRTVAGHRVLYSESMQGTSLADAGKPFAAVASAFMCEGHNLLLIMYVSDQPQLADQIKPMIDAVIASYQPAEKGR